MSETRRRMLPDELGTGPFLPGQSLAAMLALAGARQMDAQALRARMKLSTTGFDDLLDWLERERLVATEERGQAGGNVKLTSKGERMLLGLLEQMCELPELR